jgi:hypothetical protein
MPLWCGLLVIAAAGPLRRHDDSCFVAAALFPFGASLFCIFKRHRALAIYCAATAAVMFALGFIVFPSMGGAR